MCTHSHAHSGVQLIGILKPKQPSKRKKSLQTLETNSRSSNENNSNNASPANTVSQGQPRKCAQVPYRAAPRHTSSHSRATTHTIKLKSNSQSIPPSNETIIKIPKRDSEEETAARDESRINAAPAANAHTSTSHRTLPPAASAQEDIATHLSILR